MEHRQKLLLAIGIAEWASVSAHLEAMRRRGVAIPGDMQVVLARELGFLYRRWPEEADSVEQAIAQARQYATEHVDEVDEVIAGAS